jgi:hypothetical protein
MDTRPKVFNLFDGSSGADPATGFFGGPPATPTNPQTFLAPPGQKTAPRVEAKPLPFDAFASGSS